MHPSEFVESHPTGMKIDVVVLVIAGAVAAWHWPAATNTWFSVAFPAVAIALFTLGRGLGFRSAIRAARERAAELRCVRIDRSSGDWRDDWTYDLGAMTCIHVTYDRKDPDSMQMPNPVFQVRRMDGPRWEMRLTAESRQECRADALRDGAMAREDTLAMIDRLAEWHPVHDHAPALEARYQVFLRAVGHGMAS